MTVLEKAAQDLGKVMGQAIWDFGRMMGRMMAELHKTMLKISRRIRGLPEFVQFCQQTERKARRRAKYYRRIRFKTMERRRRGKK